MHSTHAHTQYTQRTLCGATSVVTPCCTRSSRHTHQQLGRPIKAVRPIRNLIKLALNEA